LAYDAAHGVPKDRKLAYMWLRAGGAQGDPDGLQFADEVGKMLPAKDLAEARRMAEACIAKKYKNCG
jgi:hypothetical protein